MEAQIHQNHITEPSTFTLLRNIENTNSPQLPAAQVERISQTSFSSGISTLEEIEKFNLNSLHSIDDDFHAHIEQWKPSQIIELNIGGHLFTTTVGTLISQKETFFEKLFSGKFAVTRDHEQRIFIDRDGSYFRYILNYLRDPIGFRLEHIGMRKTKNK
jgi:hypothetical protein